MSYISGWVLSIVGVVIITVVVEIIMPEGNISKYIKGFLVIFTVFIMVSPITNISIADIFSENDFSISLDDTFLQQVNEEKAIEYGEIIKDKLVAGGYDGINIDVCIDNSKTEMKITAIFVDLSKVVLNPKNENIDIYNNIKSVIKSVVTIDAEDIIFNE